MCCYIRSRWIKPLIDYVDVIIDVGIWCFRSPVGANEMPLTWLRNFYFEISLGSTVEANYLKDYCGLFPSIQNNSFIFTLVGNAIVSAVFPTVFLQFRVLMNL